MTKKSIIISLIFAFNAIVQFLNQIIVTRIFGARLNLEIFLAAVTIPTIFVSAIYATLNDAFLPIYGNIKSKNEKKSTEYFVSTIVFASLFFLLISLLFVFLSNFLSSFFYSARGPNFVRQVAFQMQYLFITLPIAIITTLFGSYLYAQKKFYRFPIAQFIGNLLILILVIILHNLLGIWVMVISFIASIIIQILVVFPYRFNVKLIEKINLKNQILLFTSWLPLILSYFLFRSENLIVRSMASFLPTGYFVYLNLASKFFALATGVATIGIQIILLPHLVDYFTKKDTIIKGLRLVKKAKIVCLIVTSAIALIVLLIAPIIIRFLFIGGKFTQNDANITISIIPFFIIPAIGWGSYPIFFQPLMAIRKNHQIALISFISVFVAWILTIVSKNIFGPLPAISIGLTGLLLSGIILSEILWKKEVKKLIKQ